LHATLGVINLEQNQIIKIFSIAAMVFLPPTLVASIYGMNFYFMPKLRWLFGYPFALCLMIVSAVMPFLYSNDKVGFSSVPVSNQFSARSRSPFPKILNSGWTTSSAMPIAVFTTLLSVTAAMRSIFR